MRVSCPYCGLRDQREFTVTGHAGALDRPATDAGAEAWDDYLHNRDNLAGVTREMWLHTPCGAWLVVERNTVTHDLLSVTPASEAAK